VEPLRQRVGRLPGEGDSRAGQLRAQGVHLVQELARLGRVELVPGVELLVQGLAVGGLEAGRQQGA